MAAILFLDKLRVWSSLGRDPGVIWTMKLPDKLTERRLVKDEMQGMTFRPIEAIWATFEKEFKDWITLFACNNRWYWEFSLVICLSQGKVGQQNYLPSLHPQRNHLVEQQNDSQDFSPIRQHSIEGMIHYKRQSNDSEAMDQSPLYEIYPNSVCCSCWNCCPWD